MDEQSGSFGLPVKLAYRRPGWVFPFLIFSHVGAMLCVLITDLPPLLRLALLLVIAWLGICESRQFAHRWSGILLDRNDQWFLLDGRCTAVPASLVGATVTTPGFIVLVLKDGRGFRYPFILTAGRQDSTVLRRLRVRLFYPVLTAVDPEP